MSAIIQLFLKLLLSIVGPNGENIGVVVLLALLGMAVVYVWVKSTKPIQRLEERLLAHEVIKHQMAKADEAEINAEAIFMANFLSLRKLEDGVSKEDLMSDGEVHRFRLVLKRVLGHPKKRIRFFFRENHLSDMTDREFDAHAKDRSQLIINEVTADFDIETWTGSQPTRIEQFASHKKLVPSFEQIIIGLIREGRHIAIEMHKKKDMRKKHIMGVL